jgi:hypothetical protein
MRSSLSRAEGTQKFVVPHIKTICYSSYRNFKGSCTILYSFSQTTVWYLQNLTLNERCHDTVSLRCPRTFFLGLCVPWTLCSLDIVSLGHCVPWTICLLDNASLGQCVPWTMCPLDNVILGQCVPWTMCPLDNVSLGQCVLWTMCLLDNVSLGQYVPWIICSLDKASLTNVSRPWTHTGGG